MWTAKEIWEAGRAALSARDGKTNPAPAPPVVMPDATADRSGAFDPASFGFDAGVTYRICFKNGLSGEYHGAALAANFPFDPREVQRVEPVEEVGQGA